MQLQIAQLQREVINYSRIQFLLFELLEDAQQVLQSVPGQVHRASLRLQLARETLRTSSSGGDLQAVAGIPRAQTSGFEPQNTNYPFLGPSNSRADHVRHASPRINSVRRPSSRVNPIARPSPRVNPIARPSPRVNLLARPSSESSVKREGQ